MKKIFFICLSLFLLAVCSCQKVNSENLLIGTWEVTVAVRGGVSGIAGGTSQEVTYDNWIFTFNEDGSGLIVDAKDSKTSASFTYRYHQEEGIIDYTLNGTPGKWIIDKLTRDELRFHGEDDSSYAGIIANSDGSTYVGKRKK